MNGQGNSSGEQPGASGDKRDGRRLSGVGFINSFSLGAVNRLAKFLGLSTLLHTLLILIHFVKVVICEVRRIVLEY